MKICILSTVNMKHMTLISLYTSYFEQQGLSYDIICVDKYGDQEKHGAKQFYAFPLGIKRDWPVLKKVFYYLKFKKFGEGILERNKYDFIIVWNTYTAILFSKTLLVRHNKKYCLNIRDYAHENNPLVKYVVKKLVRKAEFCTISSGGFREFLPEHDYVKVHSYNEAILRSCVPRKEKRAIDEPLRITFIGYVRFFERDKQLIRTLGNDDRYVLQFFGEGSHVLEQYAKENNYKNVICKGRFEPEKTPSLLQETDVINNLYGVGNIALDTAISIRMYYAIYLNIPILVFEDTHMSEVVEHYGIGFSVDKNMTNLVEDFYLWYSNMEHSNFVKNCLAFKREVLKDNENFKKTLADYFAM